MGTTPGVKMACARDSLPAGSAIHPATPAARRSDSASRPLAAAHLYSLHPGDKRLIHVLLAILHDPVTGVRPVIHLGLWVREP